MKHLIWIAGGFAWAAIVGIGMHALLRYSTKPQQPADPPRIWPSESSVPRIPGRSTLLIFAHPKCPCTRASLEELALLMTHCQGQVSTYVLFVQPSGAGEDWAKSDLWDAAVMIPGVRAVHDSGGVEAARFRAFTSGQAILYGAEGNLLFSGGITAARGHVGDNDGRAAVVALVHHSTVSRTETPVFGCALAAGPDSGAHGGSR